VTPCTRSSLESGLTLLLKCKYAPLKLRQQRHENKITPSHGFHRNPDRCRRARDALALPNQRRWLSLDPVGEKGGFSLFGFVGNRPIDWVDPFGMDVYHIIVPSGGVVVDHHMIVGDNGRGGIPPGMRRRPS
jgi:hypothetical protein